MIEKPGDERLMLYTQFKNDLREGNLNEFYDVDDLIAIADQAADLGDDYIQLEAILRGYRFFPDNEELGVRRGYIYHDLQIKGGAEGVASQPLGQNPLWTLLRLLTKVDNLEPGKAQQRLDKLIERTEEFDDEAIIQLVNVASKFRLYSWLKNKFPVLRKKTTYLPTLLLEFYRHSDSFRDVQFTLSLLEELTDLEPFNIDFWNATAREYINLELFDKAIIPLDYALAIDSEDLAMIELRGITLLHLGRINEARELLQPYYKLNMAADNRIAELYARALIGLKEYDSAANVLFDRSVCRVDDFIPIEILLKLRRPEAHHLLALYLDYCEENEQTDEWYNKIEEFYEDGDFFSAKEMYSVENEVSVHSMSEIEKANYYSALYLSGAYEYTASLFLGFLKDPKQEDHLTPDSCVAGLLSLCRLQRYDEAKAAIKAVERKFPLPYRGKWNISATLSSIGFSTFLNMLGTMLLYPDQFDIEAIDLFTPNEY
ncbi:MAG: hypothetical protein K2K82_00585 [Muribaculaceae bacterium]|nr:hypothetical protein [Muribaculaceae bacterium]